MENYYDEVIEEIQHALDQNKLEDADFLIRKELSMPYIPQDAEEKLMQLKKDLSYRMSEREKLHEESLDELLQKLKGKPQTQLDAAGKLGGHNLRNCVPQLQKWLSQDPVPEAAALVIEALGEQEIQEEFTYTKNGIEYTFYGDSVTPVVQSEGFLKALQYLKEWLSDNPALLDMAKTLLIHEAYMYLPLSYEKEEAVMLAEQMALNVCSLMNDEQTKKEILRKAEKGKNS